ncbi:TetR/AcrR family transcriptional regulator [Nocardioides alcanivorans]|uniref:TetR/AcrR family transcriptional regulator n=1 Tax=Nocardioides alcanivorans TaxID=2897352 RepID=UPI001F3366C3|nr:TetR/AcrR family transcriptional regulator [Nocardioides alcanivorans]
MSPESHVSTVSAAPAGETAVRRRTRRAIIDAAVRVWAEDWTAPLATVAERAGVSRSTLHRYFADRAEVVDACLEAGTRAFDMVESDRGEADPTGSGLDELLHGLEHVVSLGHWVMFLWTDPHRFEGNPKAEIFYGPATDETLDLVRRGQADGSLSADVPPEWLLDLYYSVIYCAAEITINRGVSVAEATRFAVRALRGGITG